MHDYYPFAECAVKSVIKKFDEHYSEMKSNYFYNEMVCDDCADMIINYFFGATSAKLYYGLTESPNGNIYYSDAKGIIQFGWQTINNKNYYALYWEENPYYKYGR